MKKPGIRTDRRPARPERADTALRLATAALLACCLAGAACHRHRYETVTPADLDAPVLGSLVDGATTRDAAIALLGEPSLRVEDGRILAFRLDKKFEVVEPAAAELRADEQWGRERYSLILVFDDAGLLARHRLIRVR